LVDEEDVEDLESSFDDEENEVRERTLVLKVDKNPGFLFVGKTEVRCAK
jgi:hypothetical protein